MFVLRLDSLGTTGGSGPGSACLSETRGFFRVRSSRAQWVEKYTVVGRILTVVVTVYTVQYYYLVTPWNST